MHVCAIVQCAVLSVVHGIELKEKLIKRENERKKE